MPTTDPTGYETYIYDHNDGVPDKRQFQGPLHDPTKLPKPECAEHVGPFIMVEPSYAYGSNDVFVHFRNSPSIMLNREIAEQLRDALMKVCEKERCVEVE